MDVILAVVDGDEVEIGGGAKQQKVSKCEGRPSEKQNLVSSKESTPAGYWYYSDKTTIPV